MTNSHQEPQDWEERFDKEFGVVYDDKKHPEDGGWTSEGARAETLKDFMRREFAHQNAEHQKLIFEECESAKRLERERIIGLLEGMVKELAYADGGELSYFRHTMTQGFNKALDEAITLINAK